jgi:signal transduction histidine kinase
MEKLQNMFRVVTLKIKSWSDVIIIVTLFLLTIGATCWISYSYYKTNYYQDFYKIESEYNAQVETVVTELSENFKTISNSLLHTRQDITSITEEHFKEEIEDDVLLVFGDGDNFVKTMYINTSGETVFEVEERNGNFTIVNQKNIYGTKPFFAKSLELTDGEIYLTNYYSDNENDTLYVTISTPVYVDDEINGVLAAELNFSNIVKNSKLAEDSTLTLSLINADGNWGYSPTSAYINTNAFTQNSLSYPDYNFIEEFLASDEKSITVKNLLYVKRGINMQETVNQDITKQSDQLSSEITAASTWYIVGEKEVDSVLSTMGFIRSDIFLFAALFGGLLIAGVLPLINIVHKQRESKEEIKKLSNVVRLINKILRHDLANKLTQIKHQLELYTDDPSDINCLTDCGPVIDEGIRLINDMQELESTLQTGASLSDTDIFQVINELSFENKNIQINVTGQGRIKADNALKTAFSNIIENAWKHGKATNLDITIEDVLGGVQISFADNGKGMTEEEQKKYIRNPRPDTNQGKGLGLYIVIQTAERYGGKVWVENNTPKGTIVTIYLPKI